MKKQRRPFTLLEVVIALALTGMLLTVLFSSYRQSVLSHIKIAAVKQKILNRQLIQQRLSQLFAAFCQEGEPVKEEKVKKKEATSPFYTASLGDSLGEALIFDYDQEIDPNPDFCGQMKAKIYLNQKKELCLLTESPSKKERKEVLMDNLFSLKMEFFGPSDQDPSDQTWRASWSSDRKEFPLMVKISLKESASSPSVEFYYSIPSDSPISYEESP